MFQPIEHDKKFKFLVEYYKFHKEIPRIFIKSVYQVLNR